MSFYGLKRILNICWQEMFRIDAYDIAFPVLAGELLDAAGDPSSGTESSFCHSQQLS
jgi:hypothetical protein